VLTFLKYIAESLHSLANAQNLMLRVESDQTAIVMDYDPERLLQIVHNLLSNAIKFTPSGGRVVMRADVKDKWLHLSVSDSGVGIPPDELPHLFERFFQAKNQEHSKAGGTGIGLSLTHELVKALGGEISVVSTVGSGTTFLVKLPITNKSVFSETGASMNLEGWKPSVARPQALPTATQAADSSLPQILLVEDNPDVVEYLAACLQGQYTLDFAYNGRAGIEKALDTIPDFIVSDVMMPEKDGFEVVEALKNDERTSHIPIILLTAKADVESRLKGLRRGADAYLSKPFHQEELLVTVENLLEQRRKLQEKYAKITDYGLRIADSASHQSAFENPQSEIEDVFLQKFRSVVEANLSDSDFEMPQLERALAMSRSQIFRKVKALTGKSPSLLIRSIRLHHGRHLLKTTTLTVSEIAYQVGYAALNNFSDAFQEEFGERPTAVRG
jgi:DNA-binding response OmpR family regulator